MGCCAVRRNQPSSRKAHRSQRPSFSDWNTKYLPSWVHLPQHSLGGSCQLLSRGCSPVPSAAISHNEVRPPPAVSVKRLRLPSGDTLGQAPAPAKSVILCPLDPSFSATYMAGPLMKTMSPSEKNPASN